MTAARIIEDALASAAEGRAARAATSLLEFIPHVSPGFTAPRHLAPYVEALERSWSAPVRAVISAPPRHGKSETTLHFIVQSILRNPRARVGYCTYAAEFSEQQAKRAARIAENAGVKLVEQRASFWRTREGGEVIWTSIGGPLTGKGVDLLVVDDPVKGRAEAESTAYREAAWEWFTSVAFTRLEPRASIVVMATRWHPDDLSGRLAAHKWPVINLPAVNERNEPLWPERYDLAALEEIRALNEYDWWSLYQGQPRSKGGRVFGDAHLYDDLPTSGYRVSIGADFAYSSKTHADYSVAVVLVVHEGRFYVADVVRRQCDAPAFRRDLKALRAQWSGPITAYIGGTEKGVVDFLRNDGVPINALPAIVDKFARAQPAAAAWNAGRILVPRGASWVDAFVSELCSFTGVGDRHDDQVDSLAGAFAPYATPLPARGVGEQPIFSF